MSAVSKVSQYNETIIKPNSGYLLIFNQEEFNFKNDRRFGSQKDVEALCRTFGSFGFKTTVKSNLTVEDVNTVATTELLHTDFKDFSCCVIVVLSHGNKHEAVQAADGSYRLQTMLVDRLVLNKTLHGKAKIFIVSACKGKAEANHVHAEELAGLKTDALSFKSELITQWPNMRDVLKCYSTFEGFVSWRDEETGTLFVQELCKQLDKHGNDKHFEDIMKHVNNTLTVDPVTPQVPSVTSTMSFNIYFAGDRMNTHEI